MEQDQEDYRRPIDAVFETVDILLAPAAPCGGLCPATTPGRAEQTVSLWG